MIHQIFKKIHPIKITILAFGLGMLVSFTICKDELTEEIVQKAATLIGLDFTSDEIEMMLPDLEDLQKDFQENRTYDFPNSLAPALIFNPLPQGYQLETTQKAIQYSNPGKVVLPENRNELAYYSIQELAELLRSQQITSVELTTFFLNRLKKYNDSLHCVITLTEELAMQQAQQADEEIRAGNYKGMLHGIPYGAKDLFSVKGYKTTWGAMPFKDQRIEEDATVIKKLEAAGAVLCAKLTLGALAWGDVWYGEKTRNPWDTQHGSSGSSAGSASSVSAGLLPFALGTETLGSIVSPATVCGNTGLRPTFGRVSRAGAMALSWSMDKVGPICRSVEDCAIVFEVIRGKDEKDAATIAAPFNYDANLNVKKLRIGYVKSHFERKYGFKSQDSLTLLKLASLGIELIPIELPGLPDINFILEAEAAAAFDELTRSNEDDKMVRQIRQAWPNSFRKARFIPAVEYIQANRLRSQLIEDMNKVMQEVDLYLSPSWATSSLSITNLTGHPCVVLPNGFLDGRPTSITFTGKLFEEGKLLAFAKYYQDNTKFHLKHPEWLLD